MEAKSHAFCVVFGIFVPVAQLDRALDCGSNGRRFKSSRARQVPGTGTLYQPLRAWRGRVPARLWRGGFSPGANKEHINGEVA